MSGEGAETQRYGFGGRLSPAFPSQVIIDCTEICNLECIHCPHPTFKASSRYTGRSLDPELNAKLVEEVREYGRGVTQYLRYTGEGEPLVHPRLWEMLALAAGEAGTLVSLTTNGTLLDPPRIERLIETGVDVVDVSIDAFRSETYARIRKRGNLQKTRDNVLALLAAAGQPSCELKVVVSYVEQPENVGETAEFEAFWRDAGAEYVVVRRLHSNAGNLVSIADRMRRSPLEAARRPCLYPWERISLTPRGELLFCPQDWDGGSVLGDYYTTTIRETWSGRAYARLRAAHLENEFSAHPFCGACPDWQQSRWPWQTGRSYADLMKDLDEQT